MERGRGWLAVLVTVAAACSGVTAPTEESTTSSAPTTTSSVLTTTSSAPTTTTLGEPVDWSSDFSTDLGGGYSLSRCPGGGEAPIVCVWQDGATIGSVEYLAIPAETLDYLAGVDDPVRSAELLAADYLSGFRRDRESTCPDLEFREAVAESAILSGLPGVRFGFSQFEGEREVERNLVFAAREGAVMLLVNVAALVEGACVSAEGEVLTPAELAAIFEGLSAAVSIAGFGGPGG